jgi:hypothetical protein
MRTAVIGSLALFSFLVAFARFAPAEPIYQWKDEKGLWHFTDFLPPPGTTVTKIFEEIPNAKSRSVIPELKTNATSARNQIEKTPVVTVPATSASKVSAPAKDPRWLFILPPTNPATTNDAKQFLEWIPDRLFKSDEACETHKALLILDQIEQVSSQLLNSECIQLAKYTSGPGANVIVGGTVFVRVTTAFNSHFVSGRVFNRGQGMARDVIAKYYVQDSNGVTLASGEVSTTPGDIPGLSFGDFRTPEIGAWNPTGLKVRAEATWSNK